MPLLTLPAGRLFAAWDLLARWRSLGRRFRVAMPAGEMPRGTAEAAPVPAAGPAAPTLSAAEARALWIDRLWGPGFLTPGGEAEVLRLAFLLPLSPATTVLLVGRDGGGAAAALAGQRGAWVAAHQHDPWLTERLAPLVRPFGRRVAVQPWDPAAPAFRARYHHHALALEPMQAGAAPGPLCQALATAIKPAGQLVLLETVAMAEGEVPGLARWLTLDGRAAPPPPRAAVETALQAAGFALHVTESLGPRHAAAATEAWQTLLAGLRDGTRPAGAAEAAALVTEAERWLLHQRLLRAGALAVLRWHATLRG
ncbi:hypothetical protein [Paracraurococcus lichenis]|uniref:Class I SAM-dependent methyltransferase n=1 Tax=Paracraurococcus lichenis TaxID=3064888 RepID=A0ABT9E7I0_9PROT|nr:hypothetical protein [Paracraurococcus sp. LOR1-02]MDO9712138.1 hypothetical protein [Paracraurococcus sp. LOR1-02]